MINQDSDFKLWVSNTSIKDFLTCPRLYYLKHVYKDPKTRRKISLINQHISLGVAVHDTLDSISELRAEERFKESLIDKYYDIWKKVAGDKGGFTSLDEEKDFMLRGEAMIQRIIDSPGPLLNKAIKLKDPDGFIPNYYLSEDENIILCGKIDWIEYLPETDGLHIIDFKTGRREDSPNSLQLEIYCLLVKNLKKREIKKISFWYLDSEDRPSELPMPNLEEAYQNILAIARRMKFMRDSKNLDCLKGGCYACLPMEQILKGEAKYIQTKGYQDIYVLA